MSKLRKGKVLGIAAACLLVASLAGALVAPAILAQEAPAVSIDPAAQDVVAGGTFDIDVWVDAGDNNLKGIDVAVEYDADAMTTTEGDVVGHNLLGGLQMGPEVTEAAGAGEVTYQVANADAVAGVDASVMTITFTMDAGAAPGDYDLTITKGDLVDENALPVVVEINDGTVTIPGAPAPAGPSVSIDPAAQDVMAGNTFTIDVLVDADGNDLMGIDVEVGYDSDAMTTSEAQITGNDLLGDMEIGPTITDGEVRYALLNVEAQAGIDGSLMSIEFTVNEGAEPGDYALAIAMAELVDGEGELIPDVAENDGTVTVLPAGPVIVDETFEGTLAEGDRDFICTIPTGASDLAIDLTTAASPGPDLDLELYDGTTMVIGDGGYCSSGNPTTCTYGDDTFGYSGYNGGEEYITADGPLGQAYDLKVFAYEAGDYTVTVSYVSSAPLNPPPTITIDVPAGASVGNAATVTVSATDVDGVAKVMFTVSNPDVIQSVMSFDDEMSLTFVPGLAGTYTVEALALDGENNMTPEGAPKTATFVVSE